MTKEIEIPEGYEAKIDGNKVILVPKESEDERIRKELIDILKKSYEFGGLTLNNKKDLDRYLAYLEKQKVNIDGDFARGYDCGYQCCLNSHGAEWFEKQKEQKPSEWKPLEESMEALLLAIEGKWDAIKPTGYMSRRLEDLYDGLVNTFNIRETYLPKTNCTEKDIEELKTLKSKIDVSMEQKPAEWSEEDEKMLKNIEYALHKEIVYSTPCGLPSGTGTAAYRYQKEIDWLKSLRPQSNTEWSKEDERIRLACIATINDVIDYERDRWEDYNPGKPYRPITKYDEQIDWLKSLRPQSHWKPSEEQMEVLLNAEGLVRANNYPENAKILASLYEQLKKL